MNYKIEKDIILFEFLKKTFPNKSKNNLKSMLKNNLVLVNDKIITKYDYLLEKEDIVKIISSRLNENIDILYEDKYLLIVLKPHNLLTISTEKEKEKTLYHYVSNYVKIKNKNNKIFIIHRLDYETKGIIVFAKDIKTKNLMQQNWDNVKRNYIALVNGSVNNKKGQIKLNLLEKNLKVIVSNKGKESVTNYEVIKQNKNNTMLKINLKTGRKNQIRISLKEIGHPIIGDSKYGKKEKIMYLYANEIEFIHPITKKNINIKEEIPSYFERRYENE